MYRWPLRERGHISHRFSENMSVSSPTKGQEGTFISQKFTVLENLTLNKKKICKFLVAILRKTETFPRLWHKKTLWIATWLQGLPAWPSNYLGQTVDRRNPANSPVDMVNISLFAGFWDTC